MNNKGLHKCRMQRHAARQERMDQVRQLWHQGIRSDEELAKAVGVNAKTVTKYRCEMGLYILGPYSYGGASKSGKYRRRTGLDAPDYPQHSVRAALSTLVSKTRECLRCNASFRSEWAGNRMCNSCRKSHAWRSGGDFSIDGRI